MAEITPSGRELDLLKVLWKNSAPRAFAMFIRPSARMANVLSRPSRRCCGSWPKKGSYRSEPKDARCTIRRNTLRNVPRRGLTQGIRLGSLDRMVLTMLEAEGSSVEELKKMEKMIAWMHCAKSKTNRGSLVMATIDAVFYRLAVLAGISFVVLAIGGVIAWRLCGPIERLRCIEATLIAVVAACLLQQCSLLPQITLRLLPQTVPAAPTAAIAQAETHPENFTRLILRGPQSSIGRSPAG